MPKPIINNNQQTKQKMFSSLIFQEKNTFKSPELSFREKRPQSYINIIKNLDLEGSKVSEKKLEEIINQLQNAVPEIVLDEMFIGILGKCELGAEYDVHTISKEVIFGIDEVNHLPCFGRMILKHFKIGETLPDGLEKGRNLAVNPNYVFVEIYNDKIIAVQENGSVAIIKD